MDDKHDPNGSVPIGTFKATSEDGELEIPIEIVADDLIEEQQLSSEIEKPALQSQGGPLFRDNEPPRRQRVATLIGVQLPGAAAAGATRFGVEPDPAKASRREISAAVDDALDERPTTIYGYKQDSLAELEHIVESEMTEIPSSADHTSEIVGVVGRSSDTGTFQIEVHEQQPDSQKSALPVLAPAQFVEARAREQRDQAATESVRELLKVEREREQQEQPTAAIASRGDRVRAAQPAREKPAAAVQKPISSLAPLEVHRARTTATKREPRSAIGYALVAAMVLLGIGGWFLTSGGYRRSTDTASQPTAAASLVRPAEPLGSAKLATVPPAPVENAVPTVPTAPTTENAAPTVVDTPAEPAKASAPADLGTARPRVAGKTVKKAAPAPVPAQGPIEAPSRDDVLDGLDRVRSNVRACAEGRSGVAEVDLTIAASGVVTNALVGGDFGGTPQGSCIARAVRKARFPTFKQDRYRVLFPYVL